MLNAAAAADLLLWMQIAKIIPHNSLIIYGKFSLPLFLCCYVFKFTLQKSFIPHSLGTHWQIPYRFEN